MQFWQRAAANERISDAFRAVARVNGDLTQAL
jgi:hypothetical protein